MPEANLYRGAVTINGVTYLPIDMTCINCGYAYDGDDGLLHCGGLDDIPVDEDDTCPGWDFGEYYPEQGDITEEPEPEQEDT